MNKFRGLTYIIWSCIDTACMPPYIRRKCISISCGLVYTVRYCINTAFGLLYILQDYSDIDIDSLNSTKVYPHHSDTQSTLQRCIKLHQRRSWVSLHRTKLHQNHLDPPYTVRNCINTARGHLHRTELIQHRSCPPLHRVRRN